MILYLAGVYTSTFGFTSRYYSELTDGEKKLRQGFQDILESYHYVYKQSAVDAMRRDGVQVFLDSGAFSAYTKGIEVDLPAYCDYIKRNDDVLRKDDGLVLVSVLDGIGDPELTLHNQKAMEARGVRPLPCFHYGEDERYLEYYIANYDYITLGGMVPISTKNLLIWLDRIWGRYLTDGSGKPRLKVHGFGLTTFELMQRYPWYSVDSSTWIQTSIFGNAIIYPEGYLVSVSDKSPNLKQAGKHFANMTDLQRERLTQHFHSCGIDVKRLAENPYARWAYNGHAFIELGKQVTQQTTFFKHEKQELF